MDQIINKENTGIYLPSNPMKNGVPLGNSALKLTVKKSVLGKLDNVMHQTPAITPFKSHNPVKPEGSIAKLSLRKTAKKIVNRQREESDVKRTSCFLGAYMVKREVSQPINLFNYTDFPSKRCVNTCSKPITEIWLENQSGYDDLCERILHDIHPLEDDRDNEEMLQLDTDFDQNPHINDLDVESEEFEPLLDLPLPSFIDVDLLF